MAEARRHGWWPYLAPYGLFLLLVEFGGRVPDSLAILAMALRVVVPGALIVWFWRAGQYPELSGYRVGIGSLADLAMGVLIAVAWVAPFALFPELGRGSEFDAGAPGSGERALTLGLRLAGFALVTPFVEELFVRSFLHRYVQVWDGRGHFLDLPVSRYAPVAFGATTLWFIFSHAQWEWGVAAVAGVLFNLWLYRRRHIGGVILAHAAANASIWFWVVLGPAGYWAFL